MVSGEIVYLTARASSCEISRFGSTRVLGRMENNTVEANNISTMTRTSRGNSKRVKGTGRASSRTLMAGCTRASLKMGSLTDSVWPAIPITSMKENGRTVNKAVPAKASGTMRRNRKWRQSTLGSTKKE